MDLLVDANLFACYVTSAFDVLMISTLSTLTKQDEVAVIMAFVLIDITGLSTPPGRGAEGRSKSS